MSFDPNDPRITAYLFDELDDDQLAAFQSEMAGSEQLRDVVEETRCALDRLSTELKGEPEMAMSDTQRKAVAEEIAKAHAPTQAGQDTAPAAPSRSRFSGRRLAAMAALAASVLIVCGVAYSLHKQARTRQADRIAMAEAHTQSALAEASARSAVGGESRHIADAETLLERLETAPDFTAPVGSVPMAESNKKTDRLSLKSDHRRRQAQLGGQLQGGYGLPAETETGPVVSSGGTTTYAARASGARSDGRDRSTRLDQIQGMGGMAGQAPVTGGGYPGPGSGGGYGGGYGAGIDSDRGVTGAIIIDHSGLGRTEALNSPEAAALAPPAPGASDLAGGSNDGSDGGAMYGRVSAEVSPFDESLGLVPPADAYRHYDAGEGTGPGSGGDRHAPIVENPFKSVKENRLSTFSIDVDTASYSKVRMHLMQNGRMPRRDAVRIEELLNYFTYDYAPPEDDVPFAADIEVADCPWTPAHRLVRFGIKGKEIDRDKRPTSNLVFLLDVSGSMKPANKLPLVKKGMKMLVDQLGENDSVAIAVYAGAAGLVLDSTTGDQKQVILDALDRLHAGGSTNGGEGIQLAYQTALDNFVPGGVNRVILCTDGDFNVGVTGTGELVRLAEEHAKTGIFLSVLGFGMGNHNDSMLEQISNKGNGNYAFIDTDTEARKVLVEQMTGTLITIAKDVKIQVDFNPVEVAAYRLIGYENRILATEDFNDDKKDAGEIGAGHTVTALYEIVPAGAETEVTTPAVDGSRYWTGGKPNKASKSGEMLTLRMRYKQPDGDTSALLEFPVKDEGKKFGQATKDFRFAAAVASFGMLLRDSQYKGNASYAGVLETATEAASGDTSGYREEFLKMIARAKEICGQ